MDTEEEEDRVQTPISNRSEYKRRQKSEVSILETKTSPLAKSLLSHLNTKGPPKRRGIPIAIPSNPPPTPILATPIKKRKIVNDGELLDSARTLTDPTYGQINNIENSILIISDEEKIQVSPLATKSRRDISKVVSDQDKHHHKNIECAQVDNDVMINDKIQSSEDATEVVKMMTPKKRRVPDMFDEADVVQTPSKLVAKRAYIIQVPSNRLSKSPVEKVMPAVEQLERKVNPESQEQMAPSPQSSPNQGSVNGHLTLPLKFLKIGTYECDGRERVVEISYRNQTLNFLVDLKEVCSINILDIFKLEYYDQNQPELLLLKTRHTLENSEFHDSYNPDSYIDKKTRILCFFDSHSQFARLRRSLVVCVQPECEIFIQKREQWASFIKEVFLDQSKVSVSPSGSMNDTPKSTLEKFDPESENIGDGLACPPMKTEDTVVEKCEPPDASDTQLSEEKKDAIVMTTDSITTPRRSTRITKRIQDSPKPLSQDLFVYPFTGVNSITITGDDVCRLSEGEFLNDNLVEFYLKYFQNQLTESNPTLADQVHFFNPFFYKRLTQKDKSNKSMNVYDKVKKWTSKINLFSKSYIFIPINENLHWYLALVSNPSLLLPNGSVADQSSKTSEKRSKKVWGPNSIEEIGDPNVEEVLELDDISNGEKTPNGNSKKWENGSQSPWIVIFDSLGARHNTVFKTLNTYLINEAKEKLNTDIQNKAVGVYAKVPCQTNYCDCGLYILQYVETFLKNPSKYLDIVANRVDNKLAWFKKEDIEGKRAQIRTIIDDLTRDYTTWHGSTTNT